ncbi:extensin family protein [Hyphomicrobium sp. D-2]|uniref:extensin-like domain-containing protein n=1 Tax=Hyphomicrobium sp. D-2 TaxID=3041621 RepID=UPI0024572B0A|nr:extensin family protein [Hyphomicrobium sp. D-2]MDH4982110.1 extensin family protein [Hyphomicrobium sp. D-2]
MLRLGSVFPLALAAALTALAGTAPVYADLAAFTVRHGATGAGHSQKARVLKVGTKNAAAPSSWNTKTIKAPPAPARKAEPEFPKPGKAAAINAGAASLAAETTKGEKSADAAATPATSPDIWSPEEVAAAKAQCTEAMKRLNASFTYQEPIKQGECGNPAPILVSRIGNVAFSPAARINCGMLVPLNTWITRNLQPAASRKFGARITSIEVMSDYSCRTALGRVGNRLSQHAYLDALDIRGFTTAKGHRIHVLNAWGPTKREIAKAEEKLEKLRQTQLAEAAIKAQAEQADHNRASRQAAAAGDNAETVALRAGVSLGSGKEMVAALLPGTSRQSQGAAWLGGPDDDGQKTTQKTAQPRQAAHTGLAKDASVAAIAIEHPVPMPANTPEARFLREAHASACKIFGTTLGPEANRAHLNHFHVDMAQRKNVKHICR